MRIALLSIREDGTPPGSPRPAFAQFAGARIVERQLDLALALGCTVIACLVDTMGKEVVDLQHRAERAGAKFVPLRDPRPLSGLVKAADDLIVIAPAVLPDAAVVSRQLAKHGVLAFPADPAVSLGYERINAEFAWAGILLTHGAAVERLNELEPDADVPSALMRIALQSGTRVLPVEKRLLDEGAWHIRPSTEVLSDRESRWIKDHAMMTPFSAPGTAVSERIGVRVAQDLLGRSGERAPTIAAALSAVTAAILLAFDFPTIALGFVALMATLVSVGRTVERIGNAGQFRPEQDPVNRFLDQATDPLLILALVAASPEDEGWLRVFVPVILLGLLRLGARTAIPKWRASYADRITLTFMLAPAAFFGFAMAASAVLALLVLISLFLTQTASD